MQDILIKKVTFDDLYLLQGISLQTFSETFASSNTEENMNSYLEESLSIDQLTAELNDDNSAFYFAVEGEHVVGYLKVNFGVAQTELKGEKSLEIERIYVLKEFHGKGVAQLLYDKAIAIAQAKHADYVWLGVWEENPRAIRFYQKN